MITKGIIKSIDLLGNTCTVHIPFFETAGNDQIIETATVSNTPGSYNGYKVGDVVYVAFEDGSMSHPVIIGKLYLGTEKEKADPRGVINVEESSAAKKATLPADSQLSATLDSNVPNTTVPYSSLSSIANGLNSLSTEVAQNDRDYGNRFKQVSSTTDGLASTIEQTAAEIRLEVSDTKEGLESAINQTAGNINARVDAKLDCSNNGGEKVDIGNGLVSKGLGWDLTNDHWVVKAYDQNTEGTLPEEGLDLFKITRDTVEINAPYTRLSGYPSSTEITYAQTTSNTIVPDKNPGEDAGYTWVEEMPKWEDGKYIWQRTTIKQWEYKKVDKVDADGNLVTDENGNTIQVDTWVDTIASDKIVCLAGASTASYWLNCSTKTHTGDQQSSAIEIVAMIKVGTEVEQEDTAATLEYRWAGDTKYVCPKEKHKLSLSTNKIKNKNLEIIAKRNGQEYARETIVYSPLNTPILVLSKDSGSLAYDSYGLTTTDSVTVKASVLLNNSEMPDITYS